MSMFDSPPFEIHVHADIPLRRNVSAQQVQDALKPMWSYTKLSNFKQAARSAYENEPGLLIDAKQQTLYMCWTIGGDMDFRHALDDVCMNLNDIAAAGAVIEVGFFEVMDDAEMTMLEKPPREEMLQFYVGPTPGDILQVQRNLMVDEVVAMLEEHFEMGELTSVVNEIDKLFHKKFDDLVASLEVGKAPQRSGGWMVERGGHQHPRHFK